MKHNIYKTGDKDVPCSALDKNGEVAGELLSAQQQDDISDVRLDYVNSTWVIKRGR